MSSRKPKQPRMEFWYWLNVDRVPGVTFDIVEFVYPEGVDPAAGVDSIMRLYGVDPMPYRPYLFEQDLGAAQDRWRAIRRERKAAAGGSE